MKYDITGRIVPTINGFKQFENGGDGSGNFGHAGRPGEVGGSAPEGSAPAGGSEGTKEKYDHYTAANDETEEFLSSHENVKKMVSKAMDNIFGDTEDAQSVGIKMSGSGADGTRVMYDEDSGEYVYEAIVAMEDSQKLNRRVVETIGEAKMYQLFDKDAYFTKGERSMVGTKMKPDSEKISAYLGKKFKELTGKDYTKVDPDNYYSKTNVGDNTELYGDAHVNPIKLFAYALNEPNHTEDSKKISDWVKSQKSGSIK